MTTTFTFSLHLNSSAAPITKRKKRRSEACQGPKILQHDKDQRSQTSGNQKETVTTDGSTARSACHSKEPMCMHLCTFKYYYKYKYIYIYICILLYHCASTSYLTGTCVSGCCHDSINELPSDGKYCKVNLLSRRLPPQPITVELVTQPAPEYSEVEARGACHRDSNLVLIGEKCLPGTSDGRESQESIKGGRRAS